MAHHISKLSQPFEAKPTQGVINYSLLRLIAYQSASVGLPISSFLVKKITTGFSLLTIRKLGQSKLLQFVKVGKSWSLARVQMMFNPLNSANHSFESLKDIVSLSFRPWTKNTGLHEKVLLPQ